MSPPPYDKESDRSIHCSTFVIYGLCWDEGVQLSVFGDMLKHQECKHDIKLLPNGESRELLILKYKTTSTSVEIPPTASSTYHPCGVYCSSLKLLAHPVLTTTMSILNFRPRVPRTFKSLTVNDGVEGGRWANPDVLPVPPDKRTFDWKAFFAYW